MCGARRGGANLNCGFLENAFVLVVPNIVVAWAPLGLPLRPFLLKFTKCVYQWFVLFEDFDYSGDV